MTAHEPVAEIFPGDTLDGTRLQLCCTTLYLGQPEVIHLSVSLLKAIEQPRRNLGAVVLVQLQGLAHHIFHNWLHGEILPCSPAGGPGLGFSYSSLASSAFSFSWMFACSSPMWSWMRFWPRAKIFWKRMGMTVVYF